MRAFPAHTVTLDARSSRLGVVNVFWAASPELIRTLGITSRAILLITPLPDSSLVALGSGNVLLFVDTATFHVVQSIPIRASGSLAFTPDGKTAYAAAPNEDKVVILTLD